MSLDIGAALREGAARTVERNGLLLVGVFVLIGLATAVASQSLGAALPDALPQNATNGSAVPGGPGFGGEDQPTPLALPMPAVVAAALTVAMTVLTEAVRIVSVRTFVSDETERVPRGFVGRNIGLATLNGLLGALVVGVLVAVGLVLLVVPGLFLAVGFLFVRQEIAVEDANFVDAMANSWALAKGNRIEVLVLAVVVVAVDLLSSLPQFAPIGALPATLATTVLGAVTAVFGIAVVSRAYAGVQTETETEDEEVGALGPDDIEEPSI